MRITRSIHHRHPAATDLDQLTERAERLQGAHQQQVYSQDEAGIAYCIQSSLAVNALLTFLAVTPLLLLIVLANLAERAPTMRTPLFLMLGTLNGLTLLVGLGLTAASATTNPLGSLMLLAGSAVSTALLVPSVRRIAARWLRLHAESAVATTALSLTAWALGVNLFQAISLSPLLFERAQQPEVQLQLRQTYLDILVFPLLTFLLASFLGVGLYTRRTQDEVLQRLGFQRPSWRDAITAALVTPLLVGLALATEALWRALDPQGLDRVGGLSRALLGDLRGVTGALAIGVASALGEEVFFRGAYQPRMGIPLTALLFTSFHTQYGITPATALVFVIGIVLGLVRRYRSLNAAISVHFLYNVAVFLLEGTS